MPSEQFINQLKALVKGLSPAKKIALVILVVGTLAGLVFMTTWSAKPDFQLLYSNLSPEDAGAIVSKLKEQRIPYQIASDGKSILIPREKVYESRMELASQGLPQGSGVGFEIFDKTKLGMTEFVQNVNYQRACQGELSRTINGFTEVESSRVHIVMPTRSLFVKDEEPATASVALKLRPGKRLGNGQVEAIIHLVSSSVSGLTPQNVTVVDNHGRMLAGFKEESAVGQASSDQLEYQEKVEKGLEQRVKSMLEAVLGPGKAIARVSASLDFVRQEKTEERYIPENKVVRSEQLLNQSSNSLESTPMGVPGVGSNMSEEKTEAVAGAKAPGILRQDKTRNYEIGKVVSHQVMPMGGLNRISAAVIVDGTYKAMESREGESVRKYFPRTQEEMQKLENIVMTAINFDANRGDKVEVVNIPFEASKMVPDQEGVAETGWMSQLMAHAPSIRYVFLGLFLLLSFLFIARPLVRWLTSGPSGDLEMLRQLPKTVEEIEREYDAGVKGLPFREKALQVIRGEGESSVELIRDWMKEEKA